MTVKATATQWNCGLMSMQTEQRCCPSTATMLKEADRAAIGKEDAATSTRAFWPSTTKLVVPVDTRPFVVLVTAAPTDVIHAFAMPAFGIKIDAIPGRTERNLVQRARP